MDANDAPHNVPARVEGGELALPDLNEFDIQELEERLEFTSLLVEANVGQCNTNTCPNTNCQVSCHGQ